MSEAGALIKYFKSNGCVVLHKCTTIRHAKVRYLYLLSGILFLISFIRARRDLELILSALMDWNVRPQIVRAG